MALAAQTQSCIQVSLWGLLLQQAGDVRDQAVRKGNSRDSRSQSPLIEDESLYARQAKEYLPYPTQQ